MPAATRIALIHVTTVAMEPIRDAFHALWPEADTVNILEDSLAPDRAKAPDMSGPLTERIVSLAEYGVSTGSAAVLFTCSAFGSAIELAAARLPVPVLKPNEAMFEAAIARGGRCAMLYTFPSARAGMEEEFHEEAHRRGSDGQIESVFVPGAIEAVRAGDVETHNRLIAGAAAELSGFESIMLAHFSMARALSAVRAVTAIPVLSSPEQAVTKLRQLIG